MAQENKISAAISAATSADVKQKIEEVGALLKEELVLNLTNDDRKNLLKMGDKTVAFVGKAMEFAAANPGLVPPYLNLEEARKDYELVTALQPIIQDITTLQRGLEDAQMVAGSEAYDAALILYASVKGACHSNVSGAQAIHDELKKQFPRSSRQNQDKNK
jgi:hypothetical protein